MKRSSLILTSITATMIVACNSGSNTTTTIYEQPAPMCNFGGSTYSNNSTASSKSLNVANGCNPPDGSLITQLVVGLSSTNNSETAQADTYCTGTPIADGSWILTAAHCLVTDNARPDSGWVPSNITNPANIYLWQGSNLKTPDGNPVSVSAVYVHAGYSPQSMGQSNTPPADIALLKVNNNYPLKAALNTNADLSPYTMLWLTGFGTTEYKNMSGILFYRQIYYSGNLSPYVSGNPNVGELYTVGSIPVNNYVWKFVGPGDSGGGDLTYINNNFYIVGVHSWSLLNPGTYGPLPAAYGVDTSVSYYNTWINNVVNGTPSDYVVRN